MYTQDERERLLAGGMTPESIARNEAIAAGLQYSDPDAYQRINDRYEGAACRQAQATAIRAGNLAEPDLGGVYGYGEAMEYRALSVRRDTGSRGVTPASKKMAGSGAIRAGHLAFV